MKSNKGITLIALVITIIVLLILAGVSISAIVGDNGLATRANEASQETKIAEEIEKIELAIAEFQLELADDEDLTVDEYLKDRDWCSDAIYDADTDTISLILTNGKVYNVISGEVVDNGTTTSTSF